MVDYRSASASLAYGSVCSGIEAATVAWHPLGWRPQFFAEIEAFPSAVLAHHYPVVPNLGDMTKFKDWPDADIDVLVGGTPCQSFSVAGLRKGLADPRGNLALTYLAIADRYRPRWIVWENVPGVLSSWSGDQPPSDLAEGQEWESDETSDFGCFLAGLSELGYGWCYRVLDAQYVRVDGFPFAVPQRRRRVFVVGYLGDWRCAAAVLSEPESLLGNSPPRRQAGKGTSRDIAQCLVSSGRGVERTGDTRGQDNVVAVASTGDVSHCLNAGGMGRIDYETETMIAHALRGEGFDASEDGTGRGTPIVPIAFQGRGSNIDLGQEVSGTIGQNVDRASGGAPCIAFNSREDPEVTFDRAGPLGASSPQAQAISQGWAVRRLTPRECERLQGFPDDYTAIPYRGKPAADGPRYKALGNSMAVNVMRWIGTRIAMVDALAREQFSEAAE
jgi:DNA (cytosine-5)-methyltransferase 1